MRAGVHVKKLFVQDSLSRLRGDLKKLAEKEVSINLCNKSTDWWQP